MTPTDKPEVQVTAASGCALRVRLTEPLSESETCSITMEAMDRPPEINGIRFQYVPLSAKPLHCCVELECEHRFNGMALLMHFAKNAMTCPICRGGLSGERMSLVSSFVNEPWNGAMRELLSPQDTACDNLFRGRDGTLYGIWYNEPVVISRPVPVQSRSTLNNAYTWQDWLYGESGDEWSVELFHDNQ